MPEPQKPSREQPSDPGESEPHVPAWSRRLRLARAMGRPTRSQLIVAVLLAALGFATVTQVRSTELDDTYEGRREEDLIEIFNGLTGASDRARSEISQLEQTKRDLQTDSNARQAAIAQAEQRLETLNILAGTVAVTGPGLRITITEQTGRIRTDSLLDVVQELRTAGAEAMEFNDQVRLVAQSSFSVVDDRIAVDGEVLPSPYVLEVIGEPNTMQTGLTYVTGPVSQLEEEGAQVVIERLPAVEITTVRDLPRADFAEPAEGQ
ncbi:DUF881 domain-containing protein [Nocardioides houyundeii]|uniref:DUF881 domain-containing protein n=1 Tax=Nocardioides houyundeii TaxID=2045452 RepID=UPI000C78A183|nr:DUF881 domain-containing protein [Nocardioides houyundeii]